LDRIKRPDDEDFTRGNLQDIHLLETIAALDFVRPVRCGRRTGPQTEGV